MRLTKFFFGVLLILIASFLFTNIVYAENSMHNSDGYERTEENKYGVIDYLGKTLLENKYEKVEQIYGKDSYEKLDYSGPTALIVGSEGRGISQLVMKNSDFIIKIPMTGHVNSLNVSVSTGILLSRIRNK